MLLMLLVFSPRAYPRLAFKQITSVNNGSNSLIVSKLVFHGLKRTNMDWLRYYLGLEKLPVTMTEKHAYGLVLKLLTSGVFSKVDVAFEEDKTQKGRITLRFDCQEKWTTIPVLRGQYGGGTPLFVGGVYDIHSFGRLWTLGAELRKYGESTPGSVLYAKAPRWGRGRHVLGFELWQDNRRRSFYDRRFKEIAELESENAKVRVNIMLPLTGDGGDKGFQLGFDLYGLRNSKASIERFFSDAVFEQYWSKVDLAGSKDWELLLYPAIIYDDVLINNISYHGLRFISKAGASYRDSHWSPAWELESYYYHLWGNRFNLALHGFAAYRESKTLSSLYYLGGFESIRGIVDGAIFGNHAAYANAEMRYLFYKFPYLWLQSAFFIDGGGAAFASQDLAKNVHASTGIGLRLAVPQIYRMMVRFDIAFSLNNPGEFGISAGLNQLFQPYRPL
ncbi:MAG: BamA/TamA family outer membrane protein [Oligoflexales bacterium]